MTNFKKTLLVGTALVAVGGFAAGAQAAECIADPTGGTSCELTADFGAALVISDGDTVTVSADATISSIINGADATPTGILATSGTGITVTQTGVIGAVNEVGDFNIAATDTWVSQATIHAEDEISVLGTLNVDAAGAMVIQTAAGGSIRIGATGVVNVIDSTTGTVSLAATNDIYIADGGVLTITDALGLTLGAVEGNVADEGVLNINDDFETTNTIGATTELAELNVGAGSTLTAGAGIHATDITVGAGGTLAAANGNVTGDITLNAGAALSVNNGTVDGDITGSTGAESITITAGATVANGSAIDMGAGNDTITFTGAGVVGAATVEGGAGTDTIVVNGANGTFNGNITGFEVAEIKTDTHKLILNGNAAIASVEFEADGIVELAATKTLTGAIDNTTGADGAGTLTLATTGGTTTVTGAVGATNSLKHININQDGIAAFGSTVNADSILFGGAATVTFAGDVTSGDLDLDDQNATLNFADNADFTGFFTSGGSSNGTINFAGTSTFTGNVGSNAANGVSAINVNGANKTVTITGDAYTVTLDTVADSTLVLGGSMTASGALTNAGTVEVAAGETLTAATQAAATGTYVVGVNKVGGVQSNATYELTGGAWDFADDTIHFEVAANAQPLTVGASELDNVFVGTGGATLAGATVTDNSYVYGFELVANVNNTDVTVTLENNPLTTALSGGTRSVGNALLTDTVLTASTNAQIIQLQGALAAASTQEAMDDVLEAMIPDISGGNVVAATVVNNTSMGLTETRLASLRDGNMTGMAAGNMGQGLGMWGQVFGQTGDQDKRDGVTGFDVDTVGFAVGVDTQNLMDRTTLGLAFAYADTEVDSKNVDTDIDTYQFTLYGSYDIDDSTWLTGQAAYAAGDADVKRTNVGGVAGLNSSGDFDSDTWSLRAELGRDYAMDTGMVLTPSVLANYMYYDGDDYTETGAGGASLVVDQDEVSIFELGLGLDASWLFQQTDGSYVEPEVRVGYRYDFIGDEVETTNRFVGGGAAFKTEGADPAQSTFNIGGAVTYYAVNNWEFTANYDFEVKSDYDAHAGYLRAAYKF